MKSGTIALCFSILVLSCLVLISITWPVWKGVEKPVTNYDAAIDYGTNNIAVIKDFHRLFPEAISSISYFTGEFGPTAWNSTAPVWNRYVLSMQMEITLDDSRKVIVKHSEPTFFLLEYTDIRFDDGVTRIDHLGRQLHFGRREWQKVIDANGDLSVLDKSLKTNQPVEGFAKYWKTMRSASAK